MPIYLFVIIIELYSKNRGCLCHPLTRVLTNNPIIETTEVIKGLWKPFVSNFCTVCNKGYTCIEYEETNVNQNAKSNKQNYFLLKEHPGIITCVLNFEIMFYVSTILAKMFTSLSTVHLTNQTPG